MAPEISGVFYFKNLGANNAHNNLNTLEKLAFLLLPFIAFQVSPYNTTNLVLPMEEVFARRHKKTNIAGPDRLCSGRNLSPGLFI